MEGMLKHNNGYCVICEKETTFIEHNDWLRDHYLCSTCHSIPRQRALIHVLNTFFPKWDSYHIHESSPGGITTQLLIKNCKNYTYSQYFQNYPLGQYFQGIRCENLKDMTLQRARINKEGIEYIEEPIYHGKPIDANGSLVTFDWGQDMIEYIYLHANMYTIVYLQKDRSLGLDAEFLHVFVSKKQGNSC